MDRVLSASDNHRLGDVASGLPEGPLSFLPPASRVFLHTAQKANRVFAKGQMKLLKDTVWSAFSQLIVQDNDELTRRINASLSRGYRVNLVPLNSRLPTPNAARSYVRDVMGLLARPDADYVSCSIPDVATGINWWQVDQEIERVSERVRDIFTQACVTTPHKFVHFDAGEYRDFPLMMGVFEYLLTQPEYMHVSAGVTVPAYLPQASEIVQRLIDFSLNRVAAGGAALKLRLVKGGHLDQEYKRASKRGGDVATYLNKRDTDANFLRLMESALKPEVAYAMRLGVATGNLFYLAYAHLLAEERGVEPALDLELPSGVLPQHLRAIGQDATNPVVVYTPVIKPGRYEQAVGYLSHLIQEAATPGRFLQEVLTTGVEDQEQFFLQAFNYHPAPFPDSHAESPSANGAEEFYNLPPADPSSGQVRRDYRQQCDKPPLQKTVSPTDRPGIATVVNKAKQAANRWSNTSLKDRRQALDEAAEELLEHRQELVAAVVHYADVSVSEADQWLRWVIDSARYYPRCDLIEHRMVEEGIRFKSDEVVVFTPQAHTALTPGISVIFAVLAAGGACIVDVSEAPDSSLAVVVGQIQASLGSRGQELLQLVAGGSEEWHTLLAHQDVTTVVFEGARDQAEHAVKLRANHSQGPRVMGMVVGSNIALLTPSADVDGVLQYLAGDLTTGGGHDVTRLHTVVLVGGQDKHKDFLAKLPDVFSDLSVRPVSDPLEEGQVHPHLTPGDGARWVLEPKPQEESHLWRPGVRLIADSGRFPQTHHRSIPGLDLIEIEDFTQALVFQNSISAGFVGALFSREETEIERWLDNVEVGNAYVNRTVGGLTIGAHSVAGWKQAGVGAELRFGHESLLSQVTRWEQVDSPTRLGEVGPRVAHFLDLVSLWVSPEEHQWLTRAAKSDAAARETYRTVIDYSRHPEHVNFLRFHPYPQVTIRAGKDSRFVDVLRVFVAGLTVGVQPQVSLAPDVVAHLPHGSSSVPVLPRVLNDAAQVDNGGDQAGLHGAWYVESLQEFLDRIDPEATNQRLRVVGSREAAALYEALPGVAVTSTTVVQSGLVELQTFVRSQVTCGYRFVVVPEG